VETVLETTNIAHRIASVRKRIADAARKSGRPADVVTLIAVTKTVDATVVRDAVTGGVVDLGENRVQELERKAGLSQEYPMVRWHLIGRLQRNKVAKAVHYAHSIHGLDGEALAMHVSRAAAGEGRIVDTFAQINVSGEASKAGFSPDDFLARAESLSRLENLRWRGLMTIAPEGAPEPALHAVFAELRTLHERSARFFAPEFWNALSMGMTDDFEIAIAEGATHVRVGRAIFGERATAPASMTP
jgi:pyridoxal phosphate enzyme (YggS family)